MLLQQAVFPVMARVSSEHHHVSCSARFAARRIANAVGHRLVSSLHCDYCQLMVLPQFSPGVDCRHCRLPVG